MIIYGWGKKHRVMGDGPVGKCTHCNNSGTFQVIEVCNSASLYFVTVAKWGKTYFLVCPICSNGLKLPDKSAAQDLLVAGL